MPVRILADIVIAAHLGFVVFTVLGGLLVFKWRRVAWFHIPAALWGMMVEFAGWVCPLTWVEQWLYLKMDQSGYSSGFVEKYLIPILYPESLSRPIQIFLGSLVLGINAAIYWRIFHTKAGK